MTETKRDRNFYLVILFLVAATITLTIVTSFVRLVNLLETRDAKRSVELTITLVAPETESTAGETDGEPPASALDADQRDRAALQTAAEALAAANEANADADDSVNSAQVILSFLEGAGVLIAAALGAAAIYGFRNAQETRRELREEMDDLKTLRKEIDEYRDTLRDLPDQVKSIQTVEARVDDSLHDFQQTSIDRQQVFIDLLQASQELLLKNFREAYNAIQDVLKRDGDKNPMALYIAGWLELQQIEEATLDQAADHLQRALAIAPEWPAAIAAYGVVTRRRGLESAGKTREQFFNEAEGRLRQALGKNPGLLDLNRE